MELKLVYRALRKISDWTVNGYYSETYVEGQDNVPKNTPLVIAATHHNEIIDIATLSITIPYGRHLSFWAKSTMFKNPVMGAIMSSSGAIPVKRNPNVASSSSSSAMPSSAAASTSTQPIAPPSNERPSLFHHTSLALAHGNVVGVFPEGTSYTQPSMVQFLPGAGWVGVEYLKWVKDRKVGATPSARTQGGRVEGKGKGKEVLDDSVESLSGLKIVPVAIVYTDKAKYRSRLCVRYGKAIEVDSYASRLFAEEVDWEVASKGVVKDIMAQVEKQLKEMTINAEDWDTICAVSMARSILWGDEDAIELKDWVGVSQRLVRVLTPAGDAAPGDRKAIEDLKSSLTTYYALLHYTGIKHSILNSLLPSQPHNSISVVAPTLRILLSIPPSVIRLALFLPPLLLHIPGYLTGYLLGKLAPPGEDEAVAQFQGVGGGIGLGLGIVAAVSMLGWEQLTGIVGLSGVGGGGQTGFEKVKGVLGFVGTVYWSVWVLVKWHGILVGANYRQLQRILTYYKLVASFLFGRRGVVDLNEDALAPYTHPPLPAENLFIRKTKAAAAATSADVGVLSSPKVEERKNPPPPSARTRSILVRALVSARAKPAASLVRFLKDREMKSGHEGLVWFLEERGAKLADPLVP